MSISRSAHLFRLFGEPHTPSPRSSPVCVLVHPFPSFPVKSVVDKITRDFVLGSRESTPPRPPTSLESTPKKEPVYNWFVDVTLRDELSLGVGAEGLDVSRPSSWSRGGRTRRLTSLVRRE